MKKFRYSMQSLLVIKQKLEDQAKAAYGVAKQRLNEEEERLVRMEEKREAYLEEKDMRSLIQIKGMGCGCGGCG